MINVDSIFFTQAQNRVDGEVTFIKLLIIKSLTLCITDTEK